MSLVILRSVIVTRNKWSWILWIGLMTVFDIILTGRQSGQKLPVFVWESDSKWLLPKSNSSQFLNRNVKMLGRRLYSPSLKDVTWLEDVQLIFLIFHTFVCKFGWVDKRQKIYRQMYEKLKWVQFSYFMLAKKGHLHPTLTTTQSTSSKTVTQARTRLTLEEIFLDS